MGVEAPANVVVTGGASGLGAAIVERMTDAGCRPVVLDVRAPGYGVAHLEVDLADGLAAEEAVGRVVREHGDLVGPFASVAEQLTAVTGKLGLVAFGEKGDPFDPNRHEAVAHQTSGDVTEPTCVEVMRRGYTLGERLLRPAMVAVADPE